jgi:thiol-disulfide isomerase/thioredoxin
MRKLLLLLILLIAALFTAGCTDKTQQNQVSQVNSSVIEVTQLEQVNSSLQNGPVFFKLGAEWCGPCQEMKPILNELATDSKGKVAIISVDVDQSPELADYFEVNSVPESYMILGIENGEYVYMQEDGNVTRDRFKARILGSRDKQVLTNVLNLALQKQNANSK